MTAQEVYAASVRSLPRSERLRLATMILQDLAATSATTLDFSESWSEEDMHDLTRFSLQHAAQDFPELDLREE